MMVGADLHRSTHKDGKVIKATYTFLVPKLSDNTFSDSVTAVNIAQDAEAYKTEDNPQDVGKEISGHSGFAGF